MKRLVFIVCVAAFIWACNNEKSTTEELNKDSTETGHTSETMTSNGGAHVSDVMHTVMNDMMSQMQGLQATGDADHDFAMMMKLHHQGAINMAKIELQSGSDTTLKRMAQLIITDQQKEIDAFDRFLETSKPKGNSDFAKNSKQAMSVMSSTKMNYTTTDEVFAEMMIPHHQDGVVMAREYLKTATNENLKKVANNIIRSQQKEIVELRAWLKEHGGADRSKTDSAGRAEH